MRRLSRQAVALHAYGLMASITAHGEGYLGRADADRLALDCGALPQELVDAGIWIRQDLGYRILAGTLLWHDRSTPLARHRRQPWIVEDPAENG